MVTKVYKGVTYARCIECHRFFPIKFPIGKRMIHLKTMHCKPCIRKIGESNND